MPPGAAACTRSASPSPYATGTDAVGGQPVGVRRRGDADHTAPSHRAELDGEHADPACGAGDDDRVALVRGDRGTIATAVAPAT